MLEDVASDAEIVEYGLRQAKIKFTCRRVDTREDFLQELERRTPDLILADYSLPSFDGLTALRLAREICPETPFIFVSGAMGEEVAVDTLKMGATDYVLKQRLGRLGPAVERALREAGERRQRRAAEEKLRESEERFRTLFQTAGSVIGVASPEGLILEFNPEAERVTGWQRQEVLGQDIFRLFVPEAYREAVQTEIAKALAGEPTRGFEMPLNLRHGGERLFLWNVNRLLGEGDLVLGIIAVGQDITERKRQNLGACPFTWTKSSTKCAASPGICAPPSWKIWAWCRPCIISSMNSASIIILLMPLISRDWTICLPKRPRLSCTASSRRP
ncbi:MAG: hypothetical protein A2Z73_05735 [Deltaproteobacteria bacterium RBG_13_60_28]|nr:MAG: hypothetical protein A2Z73_05735 [Deltaproteobacteria bacterium RBG_13_60_28]